MGVNTPPRIPPKIIIGVKSGKNAFRLACPLSFQLYLLLATGKSYRSAINFTVIINPKPTKIPGTIPAKNNAATLSPMTYAYIIIIPDGGIIGPMTELAAVMAAAKRRE